MKNGTRALTPDELLQLSADRTRRTVLRCLMESENHRVRVDELVNTVCATEEPSVGQDPVTQETIRTKLHHRHLPRLAEAGVVEYEEEHCSVRYLPNEQLEALLEFIDDEWS